MDHVWAVFHNSLILSCFRGLVLPTVSWGRNQSLRSLSNSLKTTQLSDRSWDANCGISECLLPWCCARVWCPLTHGGWCSWVVPLFSVILPPSFSTLLTLPLYSPTLICFVNLQLQKAQTFSVVYFLSLYAPCPIVHRTSQRCVGITQLGRNEDKIQVPD